MHHRIVATKIISVAHPAWCATETARQDLSQSNSVAHHCTVRHRKWCATKTKLVRHRIVKQDRSRNNSVAHHYMVRHRKWCATKKTLVRHRNVKHKIREFCPFCCTNTGIYSFIHKYMYIWQTHKETNTLINMPSHISLSATKKPNVYTSSHGTIKSSSIHTLHIRNEMFITLRIMQCFSSRAAPGTEEIRLSTSTPWCQPVPLVVLG